MSGGGIIGVCTRVGCLESGLQWFTAAFELDWQTAFGFCRHLSTATGPDARRANGSARDPAVHPADEAKSNRLNELSFGLWGQGQDLDEPFSMPLCDSPASTNQIWL